MAITGFVSWTTTDGTQPNPVYIDEKNRAVQFIARENTVTKPVGSYLNQLQNLGVINGYQSYLYSVTGFEITTSTTTTTRAQISLVLTNNCASPYINGTGTLTANNFAGGTGTFTSIRIGTSMQNAFEATPILLSGATSYSWAGLQNAKWYALLRDSSGDYGYEDTVIACLGETTTTSTTTTTTTTSTTTTTTTVAPTTTTTTTTASPETFSLTYGGTQLGTCIAYPASAATYYAAPASPLGNGTQLFTSSTLATTVPDGYYSNGTNVWTASGGVLNFAISCASLYTTTTTTTTTVAPTTTTTTTAAPTTTTTTTLANCNFGDATAIIEYSGTAYSISTAAETDAQSCTEIDNNQTIYGNNTTWLTVTRFYTNSGMTIPFDGFGSWYNEYNASTSYVHQIDNDGYISTSSDCGSF